MTAKSDRRKALLAKVHIAFKDCRLNAEIAEAVKKRVSGKTSCAAMSIQEMEAVIIYLKRNYGWKDKRPSKRQPLHGKIFALWQAMAKEGVVRNGSLTALRTFVQRMIQVDAVEWLTPDQASKVIEGLKAMEKRAKDAKNANHS